MTACIVLYTGHRQRKWKRKSRYRRTVRFIMVCWRILKLPRITLPDSDKQSSSIPSYRNTLITLHIRKRILRNQKRLERYLGVPRTHEKLIQPSKSAPVRTVLRNKKFSAALFKTLLWTDQIISKAPLFALDVIKDGCAKRVLSIKSGAHLLSQGYNWDPYYSESTFPFNLT